MAEINKLSVDKVLDKLRSNDASKNSRIEQLDEKIKDDRRRDTALESSKSPP